MTQETQKQKLIQAKLGLAEKYRRLALVCKSRPKQKRLLNRVQKYRRQADDISRQG